MIPQGRRPRAFRTHVGSCLLPVLVLLMVGAGCRRWEPPGKEREEKNDSASHLSPPVHHEGLFRDLADGSPDLVKFVYRNGEDKDLYTMAETLGGGVGVIDYDGDGRYDLVFPGGGDFADDGQGGKKLVGYPCRVFRNLGGWKFQDVTAQVLPAEQALFYSHGVAVCDYDRDGWPDFLVTGYGRVALYHNVPDGKGGRKFVDATAEAGLLKEGHFWSTSAVFADLDGDGWPDLYLCQYVNWSLQNNPKCPGYFREVTRDVCSPQRFETRQHAVYRNTGKGGFEDVTAASGIRLEADFPNVSRVKIKREPQFWYCGAGLAVLAADIVNGKGRPDLYVANDETGNFLYQNDSTPGHIRLTEVAESLGATRDESGNLTGSMGVDMADIDGSGKPALFVTNFQKEQHALYRMVGGKIFVHSTKDAELATMSRSQVGWGTSFVDVDNDGWPDIVVAHGQVIRHPVGNTKIQKPSLYLNRGRGDGVFEFFSEQAGPYFQIGHRGRGLAVADLDNDGWPDLVVNHVLERPALLQNAGRPKNHWLGVQLVGSDHRDIAGSRAVLELANDRRLTQFQKAGGSYATSHDPRLIFGLAKLKQVGKLTVYWASGLPRVETWDNLEVDRYHKLEQGTGKAEKPATDH